MGRLSFFPVLSLINIKKGHCLRKQLVVLFFFVLKVRTFALG